MGLLPAILAAQEPSTVPVELPASATAQLTRSLADSKAHAKHVWRDRPAFNKDGTVNPYIEISRGDRRKWEFAIAANARAIDRVMPDEIGGYPVNYGFVPQTMSYDGDPFDALVQPTERDRLDIASFFWRYKQHEPGKFSKVAGWGSSAEGLAYVRTTHAFFQECRKVSGAPCRLPQ